MGRKSATRSVAAVMVAFLTRKNWAQAELARAVELSAEALRTVLRDLEESGFPLRSEKAHPHVYWRMTKDWYPGGVIVKSELVPDLLRQLWRLPRSAARERLVEAVMKQLPAGGKLTPAAPVISRAASEQEEQYTPMLEDAAARKRPLFMKYLTSSRGGSVSERHVSVHIIETGPPTRFVATCHRNRDLRRFRVDGILRARVDETEKFRPCDPDELAAFQAASLDGYRGSGPPAVYTFFVRQPDATWVQNNLLEGMRAESLHDGIRVAVETSGLLRLARFVVGLGEAACAESPALARAVAELALGALQQSQPGAHTAQIHGPTQDLASRTARSPSDG
jgi:predicted DNA-binding transcriptional regulator YafY